ncbi:hypothetical protein EDB81DRAFT_927233 [Dactylonectria macrodidyma]|uniref:Uncharacterized protein n=1 Tax=Dactylonectria macrodidyma TaxID=307937 RepID=A0A9P9D036_9HYPO|nr:hypothetical protein EDB81DRAFT_927233 [Dactylonectria macrodidyma]
MRFFALASLLAVAAALPAALSPAEQSSELAIREDAAPVAAADELTRRYFNPVDQTSAWPATSLKYANLVVSWEVTNLGNGNYQFHLWATGGNTNFRISNAGVTLASKTLQARTNTVITVKKTGSNFNIYATSL